MSTNVCANFELPGFNVAKSTAVFVWSFYSRETLTKKELLRANEGSYAIFT